MPVYRIWSKMFYDGDCVAKSVSARSYARKGNAERFAKKRLSHPEGDFIKYEWIVSDKNPWPEEIDDNGNPV